MRASWHCSFTGCAKPTVGPSEESSEAVTMIGKAAHICGAARSGKPTLRRFHDAGGAHKHRQCHLALRRPR